jgi:2,5-diketo-D-gluconate reductase A
VIPRSQNPARLRANLAVAALAGLPAEDLRLVDALDRGKGLGPDPATFD